MILLQTCKFIYPKLRYNGVAIMLNQLNVILMTVYNFAHSVIIDGMYYYIDDSKYKADNLDCEIIHPSSNIDHHNYMYAITVIYIDNVFSMKSDNSMISSKEPMVYLWMTVTCIFSMTGKKAPYTPNPCTATDYGLYLQYCHSFNCQSFCQDG